MGVQSVLLNVPMGALATSTMFRRFPLLRSGKAGFEFWIQGYTEDAGLLRVYFDIYDGATPHRAEVRYHIAEETISIMDRPRPGHAALAHLVILHHEHQIAPSTGSMDFHGDTFPIDWEEYYESYQPPFELKLKGRNEDDTYPHTFTVYVVVLPRRAIIALAVTDAIKSVFGMLSPKRIFTRRE
ncbi:hypothetical protein ES703_100821 [subsurface metagenome]